MWGLCVKIVQRENLEQQTARSLCILGQIMQIHRVKKIIKKIKTKQNKYNPWWELVGGWTLCWFYNKLTVGIQRRVSGIPWRQADICQKYQEVREPTGRGNVIEHVPNAIKDHRAPSHRFSPCIIIFTGPNHNATECRNSDAWINKHPAMHYIA